MDTTIRNIDQKIYRKFKAIAALKNITVGNAINEAMTIWVAKKNNGKNRL